MNEEITRKDIWDSAYLPGLVLGMVSTAYLFITQLITPEGPSVLLSVSMSLLSLILWGAKFAGCIFLMKFFMKRFCAEFPDATGADTFRLGTVIALLSAIIYAGAYLAYVTIIAPDTFAQTFETVMQTYSSMLDSNSLDAMEGLEGRLPSISFFSNLIYCFLYGTVLSSILSRSIPDSNPFAGQSDGSTDNQ